MRQNGSRAWLILTFFVLLACAGTGSAQVDPLSSWNAGPAKDSIVKFVKNATDKTGQSYVKPEDRIATFDQDGTLWVEHPIYAQAAFALERIRELASQHPDWKQREPFKSVLSVDKAAIGKFSEADWEAIIAATHTEMSTEEFLRIVKEWLQGATHPRFKRKYTELVYEPMLELIKYLQANGFQTYIVTGGGQEFVRVYSKSVYGIPPERVVGSSILTKYQYVGGKPELFREPHVFFIDDRAGKPVGINLFIGKRPIAAFGNSTGDQQMLEWSQAGTGARLEMLVLHDDPVREFAYGPAKSLPDTKVGTFTQNLYDEAGQRGWVVISMKNDWRRIFSFDEQEELTTPQTAR
jgi:phosphoglycolate phosphatase-like HAD superfamily hydrolase